MYIFLIVLIVVVSILLAAIVLIQNSKGGGLASNFASSNQIMGVRKTTDFLEKGTWGLAATVVVLSIMTAYVAPTASETSNSVLLKEGAMPQANPLNAPQGFAAPTQEQGEQPAETPAQTPAQAAE